MPEDDEETRVVDMEGAGMCTSTGCKKEVFVSCHRCLCFLCEDHYTSEDPCSNHNIFASVLSLTDNYEDVSYSVPISQTSIVIIDIVVHSSPLADNYCLTDNSCPTDQSCITGNSCPIVHLCPTDSSLGKEEAVVEQSSNVEDKENLSSKIYRVDGERAEEDSVQVY